MSLQRIARFHPFLWLGGLTLLVMVSGRFVPLNYDDGGMGTAWFVFTYALTAVFRWTSALVGAVIGTEQGFLAGTLTLFLGSCLYLLADRLVVHVAKRSGDQGMTPA